MKNLEDLWLYQEAEQKYEAFENELKNTETRKKMIKCRSLFTAKQEKLKKLEVESESIRVEIKGFSDEVDKIAVKLENKKQELEEMASYDLDDLFPQDVKESVRECESVRSDLDQLKKKTVQSKKRLLEINDEYIEILKNMSSIKKEFDALKIQYESDVEAKADERAVLKKAIENAARNVDAGLMEKYKKLKVRWNNPVARLNNERCSGCNMQLPVSVLGKLKSGTGIVVCDSCGRILFVE